MDVTGIREIVILPIASYVKQPPLVINVLSKQSGTQ